MSACDNMVAYAFAFCFGSVGLFVLVITVILVIEWWKGKLND